MIDLSMEIKFYTTKISFLFRFVNFLSSEATLLIGRMHFEITMEEVTNIKTLKTFPNELCNKHGSTLRSSHLVYEQTRH